MEEGEKMSNYFLNIEKHNQFLNIIKELKTKVGKKKQIKIMQYQEKCNSFKLYQIKSQELTQTDAE